MAVGGDIIEITYNHPTLGTGVLCPKSAEDSTYDPGGLRSNDDDQSIDSAGNAIIVMSRVRWSFEVVISWDMNDKKELDKLVALAGSTVDADWTFTNVNGIVRGGKGRPVGDLKGNGNAATLPLKVAGGGKLTEL